MPLKPRMNMRDYTVTRTRLADPVNGRKVTGAVTTLTAKCNMRPAGPKALQALEDERRTQDVRSLFTAVELAVTGSVIGGVAYDCDMIDLDGDGVPFEVFDVAGWPGHYECLAARQRKP